MNDPRLYHQLSEEMLAWQQAQDHVKEETLTDWLLYQLKLRSTRVVSRAFNRTQEGANGCDWSWTVYAGGYSYEFLVQAKRLQRTEGLNRAYIGYRNKKQIKLLLQHAKNEGALGLYALYGEGEADLATQKKNFPGNDAWLEWCANTSCPNGCFISFAHKLYKRLDKRRKSTLPMDTQSLLNDSLQLSLMDKRDSVQQYMEVVNQIYLEWRDSLQVQLPHRRKNDDAEFVQRSLEDKVQGLISNQQQQRPIIFEPEAGVYGIRRNRDNLKDYVQALLFPYHQENEGETATDTWFDVHSQKYKGYLAGATVIDLNGGTLD